MTEEEIIESIASDYDLENDPVMVGKIEVWFADAETAAISDAHRILLTKRKLLTYLQGKQRNRIKVTIGPDSFDASTLLKNYQTLIDALDSQILAETATTETLSNGYAAQIPTNAMY